MAKIETFEKYYLKYEEWFEKNINLYEEELKTLKSFVRNAKNGVEIGIGTGKFAIPIGIKIGVEPSPKMAKIAVSKGLKVVDGIAENLPFEDARFDFATMITTVCFVDDVLKSFKEAYRIVKQDGFFIVGYVDKNSKLGIKYQQKSKKSKFYANAIFYSTNEVIQYLKEAGFSDFDKKYVKGTDLSFVFLKASKYTKKFINITQL
jgi:ubiquinone/menaquinone biosynthesis C-methylase UbiE